MNPNAMPTNGMDRQGLEDAFRLFNQLSQQLTQECNPAAVDLLGEPLRHRAWSEIIARAFAPRSDDGHEISLADGRRVNLSTCPLGDEPGQIILITDVTEMRRLQDRLHHQQRLAAMGETAASLAHQIRTPLGPPAHRRAHLPAPAPSRTTGQQHAAVCPGRWRDGLREFHHRRAVHGTAAGARCASAGRRHRHRHRERGRAAVAGQSPDAALGPGPAESVHECHPGHGPRRPADPAGLHRGGRRLPAGDRRRPRHPRRAAGSDLRSLLHHPPGRHRPGPGGGGGRGAQPRRPYRTGFGAGACTCPGATRRPSRTPRMRRPNFPSPAEPASERM